MYKHSKVPKGMKVQYLKCTKIPHWAGSPKQKIGTGSEMKKGSLTWTTSKNFHKLEKGEAMHIEDNRYGFNFDASCFRPVDAKGNTISLSDDTYMEIGSYRFKTKEELIASNYWDFSKSCPIGWEPEMNLYLGKAISKTDEEKIQKSGGMSNFDSRMDSTSVVKSNTEPDYNDGDFNHIEEAYANLPEYRIMTASEMGNEGSWHIRLGVPNNWGNNQYVNEYLGKGIPKEFNDKCEKGEAFLLSKITVAPNQYTKFNKDNITRSAIESIRMLNLLPDPEVPVYTPEVVEVTREKESMQQMVDILEKVYDNDDLRRSIVPLFIGDPGLGKTKIIEQFAKEKDAKLVELITSQMSPFEISGIAMPDKDTKKMTYFNYDKIESLKDGDILFFDELLNGNPVVLNACLTILEQRRLISGTALPNVMIIAAANPQGMVPLTPQIKERFVWYNVKFSPVMWKAYMLKKYGMPAEISSQLCELIAEEELLNNNFYTPRSVDKAVSMIIKDCPTPYESVLKPILSKIICNNHSTERIQVSKTEFINPGESTMWLDFHKKSKV